MSVNIHYDSDIEKAKEIIMKIMLKHPYALKDPEPYVRVSEYNDNAVVLGLRVWAKTDDYYALKDDLVEEIKEGFDKNNIIMPYRQLEIHVKNGKNE